MKKLFSFLNKFSVITLVLIMIVSSADVIAFASTETAQNPIYFEDDYDNPVYWSDTQQADDYEIGFNGLYESATRYKANDPEAAVIKKAAIVVRDYMIARKDAFSINVEISRNDFGAVASEIFQLAASQELAESAVDGDYLAYQYGKYSFTGSALVLDNGKYGCTFNYKVGYYTTAAQEAKVTTAVNKALNTINVDKKTDYEKVKAVYDYVCKTCNYSKDLSTNDYRKFTAYGAIVDGSAVCQGYATLLYRMLREVGVNTKIITSNDHAWNIVKIDGVYYNVDATWDDNYYDKGLAYVYFLTCHSHFEDHNREPQFKTDNFNSKYQMSTLCYYKQNPDKGTLGKAPCKTHDLKLEKKVEPTCGVAGYTISICKKCGAQVKVTVNATGKHKLVVDKAVKATLATAGKTQGTHCSVCKKVITAQKTVPKLTVAKTTIKSVAAQSKGFKVTWGKQTSVDGYEIQYSTDSKFAGKTTKKATVNKNSTTTKTINKLNGNKKYYIRVRAYKNYNGKKYYSSWTTVKNVKTKK